jgi:uncharacterized protein YecT (DUF1311 family)
MYLRSSLIALSILFTATPVLAQTRAAPHSTKESDSFSWMLGYKGKSTNEFIWDSRTKRLVNTRLPAELADHVLESLGGPPDPVYFVEERYVSTSACRPHSCTEKAFLWVDTQTGVGLGAYYVPEALLIGSNGLSASTIPPKVKLALINWLTDQNLQTASVDFIGPSGSRTALSADEFKPRDRFQPPAGGPSFDCKLAVRAIEKTICNDAGLSAQDLALNKMFNEIRLGSGTAGAQDQLRDLQRNWLKDRDRDCADPGGMAACLKQKYTQQQDRIYNWIPTIPPKR